MNDPTDPTNPTDAADPADAAFWPSCGFEQLHRGADGALHVTDDYLRLFLARPELALVDESCQSEHALHAALLDDPRRAVTAERLARLQDADVRENYAVFLRLRLRLLDAGSVQAAYRGVFGGVFGGSRGGSGGGASGGASGGGSVDLPALFLDLLVQAIVRGLLDGTDALQARAAELLFRTQRITVHDGRVLAGDRDTLDLMKDTGGLGDLGRLLVQAKAPVKAVDMAVLGLDDAAGHRYWQAAAQGRHVMLLDLSHDIRQAVGHGLQFTLKNARSGLPALAAVLERWVAQMVGVQVHITPVDRIDDSAWRWHLGLDAESTALLNDLYLGQPVDDERRARLISLFALQFANPAEMHPDVAGRPVYLGLAHDAQGVLRLKPQNLLLNLPLARAS